MKSISIRSSYPLSALIPFMLMFVLSWLLTGCNKAKLPLNGDPEAFAYHTEDFPPYNYLESGEAFGLSVDILELLFEKMELDLDRSVIEVGDWASAYETVMDEPGHMIFSTVRTDERESLFKWVGPIAPHKEVILSRASAPVSLNQVADLNNYFTGVVEDYSSIDLLMRLGVLRANILTYPDPASLFRALLVDEEVQCISYSETGYKLMAQALGFVTEDFASPFTVHMDQLYYAFNIETADQMIEDFQAALDSVKQDKTDDGSSVYEKVMNRYTIIQHYDDPVTEEMVITLVDLTCRNLESDAGGTIIKINKGEAPYVNPDFPALYAFVYDTEVNMVAHATNPLLVGVSFAGKPDVSGQNFRDDIVSGALTKGSGWVDYVYTKSDEGGLFYKTTYYTLCTGSDNKQYVVCAGRFK